MAWCQRQTKLMVVLPSVHLSHIFMTTYVCIVTLAFKIPSLSRLHTRPDLITLSVYLSGMYIKARAAITDLGLYGPRSSRHGRVTPNGPVHAIDTLLLSENQFIGGQYAPVRLAESLELRPCGLLPRTRYTLNLRVCRIVKMQVQG